MRKVADLFQSHYIIERCRSINQDWREYKLPPQTRYIAYTHKVLMLFWGITGDFDAQSYVAPCSALLTSAQAHMWPALLLLLCYSSLWVSVFMYIEYGLHLLKLRFSEKLNVWVWIIHCWIILQSVERHSYFQRVIPLPLRQIFKTHHPLQMPASLNWALKVTSSDWDI